MTKVPDTDPAPKPDRDQEQERVIEEKRKAQKQSDTGELDSDATEALDAFLTKNIKDDGD
jgi:hypothetical protein